MAYLDELLANYSLDCPGNWVTFSCSGDFSNKDAAYKMFDVAQLAYALDREVVVSVDDLKKHNSYCFAKRIYLLPATE